eukprot:TRINITY_DN7380_c0_g1_i10.p1 TRINITY_DN7380_c0_g1~~TRINITY_DN7380_c0_g1_i10.p1  ORF type:complete len:399 (+),score=4.04 TRINITY_DN7380_c0_g1_i10:265-1461(+)
MSGNSTNSHVYVSIIKKLYPFLVGVERFISTSSMQDSDKPLDKNNLNFSLQDRLRRSFEYVFFENQELSTLSLNDLEVLDGFRTSNSNSSLIRRSKEQKETDNILNVYLILIQVMIFMINYYAFFPTSGLYAKALGQPPQIAGVLQAATPMGAACFFLLINHTSNLSWKWTFAVGFVLAIIGNLLYSLAHEFQSLGVLIVGRVFIGCGGVRILGRKYIAQKVAESAKSKYSSLFVFSSAIGMTLGPGLAVILGQSSSVSIFGHTIIEYTYISWIMVIVYGLYGLVFLSLFKEPQKPRGINCESAELYAKRLDEEFYNKNSFHISTSSVEPNERFQVSDGHAVALDIELENEPRSSSRLYKRGISRKYHSSLGIDGNGVLKMSEFIMLYPHYMCFRQCS